MAIFLIAGGFSFSCEEKENDAAMIYPIKEGRVDINVDEFITMYLLSEMIDGSSSVKLIIENHTSEDILYDKDFSLEYLKGNIFTPISMEGMHVESIGLIAFAGETIKEQMDCLYSLVKAYNNEGKGNYRIIKRITLPNIGTYDLCAEFEIK
jgi:hypothetical protein